MLILCSYILFFMSSATASISYNLSRVNQVSKYIELSRRLHICAGINSLSTLYVLDIFFTTSLTAATTFVRHGTCLVLDLIHRMITSLTRVEEMSSNVYTIWAALVIVFFPVVFVTKFQYLRVNNPYSKIQYCGGLIIASSVALLISLAIFSIENIG